MLEDPPLIIWFLILVQVSLSLPLTFSLYLKLFDFQVSLPSILVAAPTPLARFPLEPDSLLLPLMLCWTRRLSPVVSSRPLVSLSGSPALPLACTWSPVSINFSFSPLSCYLHFCCRCQCCALRLQCQREGQLRLVYHHLKQLVHGVQHQVSIVICHLPVSSSSKFSAILLVVRRSLPLPATS